GPASRPGGRFVRRSLRPLLAAGCRGARSAPRASSRFARAAPGPSCGWSPRRSHPARQPGATETIPPTTGESISSGFIPTQHVSLTPARQDERHVVVLVDFVPQIADEDVYHVRGSFVLFIVEVFPDHATANDLAEVERQELEQRILARRQVDHLAAALHRA